MALAFNFHLMPDGITKKDANRKIKRNRSCADALLSFKGENLISARISKYNLADKEESPLTDNTIIHNIKTKKTMMGNITFDKEFITLCAKTVAKYIKNNPDALENMPMD